MLSEYEKLKPMIVNCVHNERMKVDLDNTPVTVLEVHLSAPSIIRKEFTINKIRNLIAKHNLNLKCWEDDSMLKSDRFIISKI